MQCARFLLRRRPQRGIPEHPLGASWQIRHLPSNVVALGDHDGMAGADPSRGFHEAPPTAEPSVAFGTSPVPAKSDQCFVLIALLPAARLDWLLVPPPFAPIGSHSLCRL